MTMQQPLVEVKNLKVEFTKGGRTVSAVAGVSFEIYQGETLGLVGESGCGKSTTGRALMRIVESNGGEVLLDGTDILKMKGSKLRAARARMQMIFQDPISSLNPRRRIKDIVAEPIDIWKSYEGHERDARVAELLNRVGIDPTVYGNRYARQFSGGQCQRISIARALAMHPQMLICDEVVSSLDVSIQAQILNLLEELKAEYGLTMLFIAHDLAVVKNISDRVAVMYLGRMCEIAASETLYATPAHPYTKLLLSAVLEADPDSVSNTSVVTGEPPSPMDPPSGCRFRTRCPYATDVCAREVPELREVAPGQQVACHHPLVGQ
jgi:peptide/nickel transport system ATP-binding protein